MAKPRKSPPSPPPTEATTEATTEGQAVQTVAEVESFGVKVGQVLEAIFYTNPRKESAFRFRATHIEGKSAPKAILCNDKRIQPGKLCQVRVTKISKPESQERGAIEVEFLSLVAFRLDDDIYVEPILSKKLHALLEIGMNVLLDGPQGSGKTVLSRKIAEALGMEYVFLIAAPSSNHRTFWRRYKFAPPRLVKQRPSGSQRISCGPWKGLHAILKSVI